MQQLSWLPTAPPPYRRHLQPATITNRWCMVFLIISFCTMIFSSNFFLQWSHSPCLARSLDTAVVLSHVHSTRSFRVLYYVSIISLKMWVCLERTCYKDVILWSLSPVFVHQKLLWDILICLVTYTIGIISNIYTYYRYMCYFFYGYLWISFSWCFPSSSSDISWEMDISWDAR